MKKIIFSIIISMVLVMLSAILSPAKAELSPPTISSSVSSMLAGDPFTLKWDSSSGTIEESKLCKTNETGYRTKNCVTIQGKERTIDSDIEYWNKTTLYYKVKVKINGQWTDWSKPPAGIEVIPIAPKLYIKPSGPMLPNEKYELNWTPIPDTNKYYIVYEDKSSDFSNPTKLYRNCSGGCSRTMIFSPNEEGKYYYKVRACKKGFFGGTFCAPVSSNAVSIEVKPFMSFTSSQDKPLSNEKYELKWDYYKSSDVYYYVLYESKNPSFTNADKVTLACYSSYTGAPIPCNASAERKYNPATYYYKIKAYNREDKLLSQKKITVAIQKPWLTTSRNLTVDAGQTYTFSWGSLKNVSDVKQYELCYTNQKDGCLQPNCQAQGLCYMKKTTATSANQSFYASNPIFPQDKKVDHRIRIRYQDDKTSIWSDKKTLTIKSLRPQWLLASPNSLSSGQEYRLDWTAVPTAEYYRLCISTTSGGPCETTSTLIKSLVLDSSGNCSFKRTQTTFLTKTYFHRVRAFNANWSPSPWSDDITVKVTAVNPGLTPGHPFYVLDTLLERVVLTLTFSKEAKAAKAMGYAQEKLAEAEAMTMKNNPVAVAKATQQYEKYVGLSVAKIEQIKDTVKKEKLITQASKDIVEQQIGLNQLEKQIAPENKETVKEVQEAVKVSTEVLTKTLNVLPEKKEQIQEELKKVEQAIIKVSEELPEEKIPQKVIELEKKEIKEVTPVPEIIKTPTVKELEDEIIEPTIQQPIEPTEPLMPLEPIAPAEPVTEPAEPIEEPASPDASQGGPVELEVIQEVTSTPEIIPELSPGLEIVPEVILEPTPEPEPEPEPEPNLIPFIPFKLPFNLPGF